MAAERFEVSIEGMHCGACVRRVTAALSKVPGVSTEAVVVGRATGTLDPAQASVAAVHQAIVATGFTPLGAAAAPAPRG